MLREKLKGKNVILGSGSPRRRFFLEELGLDFTVCLKPIDEAYPDKLKGHEISDYLSCLKARPFLDELQPEDLLITSDTIVWHGGEALGKPEDRLHAAEMLQRLSCDEHEVISSVAITTTENQWVLHDRTRVKFKCLSEEEINYYIDSCAPFDKAGAYGIQEWIGFIGIEWIEGSYFNVMGFPVQKFCEKLLEI